MPSKYEDRIAATLLCGDQPVGTSVGRNAGKRLCE